MAFRKDDIPLLPGEDIVFISERDTKKYRTSVTTHQILLTIVILGTFVVFFAELQLWYTIIGIILSVYEKSVIDNRRKQLIYNEKAKLFLTNMRLIIRRVTDINGKYISYNYDNCFLDNIVKIDKEADGSIVILTDGDNNNARYRFNAIDNINSLMNIVYPYILKKHNLQK